MQSKNLNPALRIGLLFLIVASVSRWLLYRTGSVPGGLEDGCLGLLYGVAIGCMLLGIIRNARERRSSCGRG